MPVRSTRIDPTRESRGFLAEARFFFFAKQCIAKFHVRGYDGIERASELLDARGVDGFVHHHRGAQRCQQRIPIQLKTGYDGRDGHDQPTHFGITIPIVPINVNITPEHVAARIRELLDAHERYPRAYEDALHRMETFRATQVEAERAALIRTCRLKYRYEPAADAAPVLA